MCVNDKSATLVLSSNRHPNHQYFFFFKEVLYVQIMHIMQTLEHLEKSFTVLAVVTECDMVFRC